MTSVTLAVQSHREKVLPKAVIGEEECLCIHVILLGRMEESGQWAAIFTSLTNS